MIEMIRQMCYLGIVISIALIFGCAFNLADVQYQPVRMEAVGGKITQFILDADTPIHGAPCGYSRILRKGTKWEAVGKVAEGVVYRSRDQILTVECSNVFEAYLVVTEKSLVGFYLPVEKAFSPLSVTVLPTHIAYA